MDFASLATKYVGNTASGYEDRRAQSSKWRAEEEAARDLLGAVEQGVRSLDIPVGTGRLLPHIKERQFHAHGLDASSEMLAIAQARADETETKIELGTGDIRNIKFEDGHFQLVTCLRFLNWIDEEGVEEVVTELARVSSDKLLLGIRFLPAPDELARRPSPILRLSMRAIGAHQSFGDRHGLKFHEVPFLESLFKRLGLETMKMRLIERRFDGTDYAFFLLQKAPRLRSECSPRPQEPAGARVVACNAAACTVAVLAIVAFLNELLAYNWLNWAVAAAIVTGVAATIGASRKNGVGRALLWVGSLTAIAFVILYVVLDALVDPFMLADWPVAIVVMLLVLWHETVLGNVVFAVGRRSRKQTFR